MNNGVNPLAPPAPTAALTQHFWFFEQPLRNLQIFGQIFKSRPSLSGYEVPNSHGRWHGPTFCSVEQSFSITDFFFQTNDRAERQVCMSVFRNVYYLIIDSGNESRCDFSCFHLQGVWDLCSVNQIRVLFTVSHLPSDCGLRYSGTGLSLYVTWRCSRKN